MAVFVALDFETSDRTRDAACSIGMVRMENAVPTHTFSSLIRPPSPVVHYTWVHGLTWPMLKDAPTFTELWPDILRFIDGAVGLVAHNAPFDRGVWQGCCASFGLEDPGLPFYCTLKGARAHIRLPSCSLDRVCAHYGVSLNHHEALSDAMGCARIFGAMLTEGLPLERMRLGPARRSPGK